MDQGGLNKPIIHLHRMITERAERRKVIALFLTKDGKRVHTSKRAVGGRKLASVYDQCSYHPCDIPENRDKFANVVLSKNPCGILCCNG